MFSPDTLVSHLQKGGVCETEGDGGLKPSSPQAPLEATFRNNPSKSEVCAVLRDVVGLGQEQCNHTEPASSIVGGSNCPTCYQRKSACIGWSGQASRNLPGVFTLVRMLEFF